MDTGSRKWGSPYLTREFFSLISQACRTISCWSWQNATAVTSPGALNFIGSDTLYGRNWGAIEHHPFLHFELCYYQAIEFAIAKGLRPSKPAPKAPQIGPRLSAGAHLLVALDRPPRIARRRRALPQGRAPRRRRRHRRAG